MQSQNPPHYRVPLKLFTSGTWCLLSPPARAVLPVIGVHANPSGQAFPSVKLIAKLSGYGHIHQAKKGIDFLRAANLLQKEKVGKHNLYILKNNARCKPGATYFPVWKEVVDQGYWAHLTPSERAVWLLLGVKAKIGARLEERLEREHGIGQIWPKTLIPLSGVSHMSFYRALRGLFKKGLLGTWSESGKEVVEYEAQYAYYGLEYIAFHWPHGLGLEGKVSFFSGKSRERLREEVSKK